MNDSYEFDVKEEPTPTEPTPTEPTPTEPAPTEPAPVEPPVAPTELKAIVNDDVIGVTLEWSYTEAYPEGTSFKIFLNDVFSGAISNDNKIKLSELIAGQLYKVKVKAFHREALVESPFSNEVSFTVRGLIGSNDPANWIGVRLDNITVIYQK